MSQTSICAIKVSRDNDKLETHDNTAPERVPIRKTVKFAPGTISPQRTERCSCCSHRNIIPLIRIMEPCLHCTQLVCVACVNSMGICLPCADDLLHESSEESDASTIVDDYEECSGEEDQEIGDWMLQYC